MWLSCFRRVLFLCLLSFVSLAPTFNIRDYGAKGDGHTLDTGFIQETIDAAASVGGGIVLVPKGKYLTGPFNLTSRMTLLLDKDAVILGVQDLNQYPIIAPLPSYGRSRDVGYTRYQPLVFGVNVTNVKIAGKGTIDGQGIYWDKLHKSGSLKVGRPRLVEFLWSDTLEIADVTLKNPGFWNVHPVYSSNIWIHHVKIEARSDASNSDGIDPDSSSNVLIEYCSISCGDDFIAIKSGYNDAGLSYNWPTRNVTIRHCDFYHGDGISIGSETAGGISDVYIHDCVIHPALHPALRGLLIKTARGRGGVIENIRYENIKIEIAQKSPISISMFYDHVPPTHNATTTPIVRNISYSNIDGAAETHGEFKCLPESPCRGIVMDGVRTYAFGKWECENAFGSQTDVRPESCLTPEKKAV